MQTHTADQAEQLDLLQAAAKAEELAHRALAQAKKFRNDCWSFAEKAGCDEDSLHLAVELGEAEAIES